MAQEIERKKEESKQHPSEVKILKVKCSLKTSDTGKSTGNQLVPLMARVKGLLRDKSAVGKLNDFVASVFTAEDTGEISKPDPILCSK